MEDPVGRRKPHQCSRKGAQREVDSHMSEVNHLENAESHTSAENPPENAESHTSAEQKRDSQHATSKGHSVK